MLAQLGDRVTPFLVQKLSMAKNQKLLCGIASKTIVIAKTHYSKVTGSFHCFGGKCCEMFGIPTVRYGIPIYKYQTDGSGLKKIGDEVEFLMLVRGNTDYSNLLTKEDILQAQGTSLVKSDILITCTEEVYQDYTFDIVGPRTWNKLIDKTRYEEDMDTFAKHAMSVFGRTLDEGMFMQTLNDGVASTPVQDRPSVEGLKRQASLPLPKTEPVREVSVSIEDEDFADLLQR